MHIDICSAMVIEKEAANGLAVWNLLCFERGGAFYNWTDQTEPGVSCWRMAVVPGDVDWAWIYSDRTCGDDLSAIQTQTKSFQISNLVGVIII